MKIPALAPVVAALTALAIGLPTTAAAATTTDVDSLIARAIYFQRYDDTTDLARTLDDLDTVSPDDGEVWSKIIPAWDEANDSLSINAAVPTGLPTSGHVFVVLGYALASDGTMQDTMLYRLQVALAAAEAYPSSRLLLTGGVVKNGNTEATVMRDWLVANGVDESRLLLENASSNTQDNAAFSNDIMYADGSITSFTLISSASHIRRATVLFTAASLNTQKETGSSTYIEPISNVAYMDNTTSEQPPSTQENSLIASNMASLFGVSSQYSALTSSPPTLSALTSLVVTPPTTTDYALGEALDTTGMVVTAVYDSGDYARDVTADAVVSGYDATVAGTQSVVVAYTENGVTQQASFEVSVAGSAAEGSQVIGVEIPETDVAGAFGWSFASDDVVDLGTAQLSGGTLVATGVINEILVTDTRDGGSTDYGWTLSGQVSPFTSAADAFGGEYLGWTPYVSNAVNGVTAGAAVDSAQSGGSGLADSSVLASSTKAADATVGASLELVLPEDTASGDYTSTLTITALS